MGIERFICRGALGYRTEFPKEGYGWEFYNSCIQPATIIEQDELESDHDAEIRIIECDALEAVTREAYYSIISCLVYIEQ